MRARRAAGWSSRTLPAANAGQRTLRSAVKHESRCYCRPTLFFESGGPPSRVTAGLELALITAMAGKGRLAGSASVSLPRLSLSDSPSGWPRQEQAGSVEALARHKLNVSGAISTACPQPCADNQRAVALVVRMQPWLRHAKTRPAFLQGAMESRADRE